MPTIWNDLLHASLRPNPADLSSLRAVLAGGSAVPRTMIEAFRDRFGVDDHPGLGDDRDEPARRGRDPSGRHAAPTDEIDYRVKAGRVVAGVEIRICDDDGTGCPSDGKAVGEFEVRGPWITGSYYGVGRPREVP